MNIQSILLSTTILLSISFSAHASHYQICSDSEGVVSVENGKVTIRGGIGDVGPATSQKIIKTISEKHESCVEGPNYVSTIVTVEKVKYDLEEGVQGSAVVLCTLTLTGIVSPGTNCK